MATGELGDALLFLLVLFELDSEGEQEQCVADHEVIATAEECSHPDTMAHAVVAADPEVDITVLGNGDSELAELGLAVRVVSLNAVALGSTQRWRPESLPE